MKGKSIERAENICELAAHKLGSHVADSGRMRSETPWLTDFLMPVLQS